MVQLNKELSCTPEGEQWLSAALDPFHDYTIDLMGLPDMSSGPSFVSLKTQSVTVSAPPGATSSWNLNIAFLPTNKLGFGQVYLNQTGAIYPGGSGNTGISVPLYGTTTPLSGTVRIGPISYSAIGDGAIGYSDPTSVADPLAYATVNTQVTGGGFGDANLSSPGRVIAMAFEVVDVTPVLYQQGTVTCYRNPYNHMISNSAFQAGSSGTQINELSVDTYLGHPQRIPDATAVPGSRTWDAKEGIYMVGNMADANACRSFDADQSSYISVIGTVSATTNAFVPNQCLLMNNTGGTNGFALSGCTFSGLNPQFGAFRITTRIIYEYFPKCNSSAEGSDSFIGLSSPSAPYDTKAFETYSKAMNKLPVAVPVKMNNMGDWFKMVLKAVHASGVATMIHPLLGAGVGLLSNVVGSNNNNNTIPTQRTLAPSRVMLGPPSRPQMRARRRARNPQRVPPRQPKRRAARNRRQ
jgi:hypothetical protein